MKAISRLILSLLVFTSISAFAAISENYTVAKPWNQHVGRYVEFNAGTNFGYVGLFGAGLGGGAFSGAYGYHFTPLFAVEGGYMQMFDWNDAIHVPYLTARWDVPIQEKYSFIGKLGGMAPIYNHGALILPYMGVGGGYAVSKDVTFEVQYQGLILGLAGVGMLSAGVAIHFD